MIEKYTFEKINRHATSPLGFAMDCSAVYRRKIFAAAQKISGDERIKIVMLAGPSSSGKTTTAKLISQELKNMGSNAYTVSLDDFYHPHSVGYPLDENGKPDYECVDALDVELIHEKFGELAEKGVAYMPEFDFTSGERINNAKKIELRENDVIIVVGLHALNPVITETLNEKNLLKIYVSVSSRVYDNNEDVVLSKRDLRFIRRMVRDFRFRSTSVEKTFEIWSSVTRGEDKYLFPFEPQADMKIDSFHPCEPCIFKQRATELLSTVKNPEHTEKAQRLMNSLSLFKEMDASLLTDESLLREFIG